jgi:hypothetical protein
MSHLGSLSPLASPLGSGTSHYEDVYRALRSAVGTSASKDDENLDDLWRRARAVGLGAGHLSLDRAAWQALPIGCTDHLDAYERLLGLSSSTATTEQDRRERVVAAWIRDILATSRGIEVDLQTIDENFSVVTTDHDQTDTVHHGRIMPAAGSEATYGTTEYPNYSTAFVVQVAYAVPSGSTVIPTQVLADAKALLNNNLPAWVDFVISQEGTSGAGFYADGGPDGTSVADLTAIY